MHRSICSLHDVFPHFNKALHHRQVVTGRTLPVVNPTAEKKIVDDDEADAEDVDLAVDAAGNAFPAWAEVPLSDRIALCNTFGPR